MMLRMIVLTLALALPSRAAFADEGHGITCSMVRQALRYYSRTELETMARSKGVSDASIARLRRCK